MSLINGKLGFGTMSMTWTPNPPAVDDSIKTLKYVVKKYGVTFINGGIFYGDEYANLKLLKAFINSCKGEIDTSKLTISIKGLINLETFSPDGSREKVKEEITLINQFFPPKGDPNRPKLLFEPARVDKNIPFDETISYINDEVKAGEIDGISISETSAKSIALAASVATISAVEVELSFLSLDIFDNGVLAECTKQGIPIVAYSPLCKGILTEKCVKEADTFLDTIQDKDMRKTFDRFQKENYESNMKIIRKLHEFSQRKNITLEALTLSWLTSLQGASLEGLDNLIQVIPIPSGSSTQKIDANFGSIISLSQLEVDELYQLCKNFEVKGGRYNKHMESSLFI